MRTTSSIGPPRPCAPGCARCRPRGLAGEGLHGAVLERRHDPLVTAAMEGIIDTMVANRATLRRRLGEQSPSWVPPLLDDVVFDQAELVVRRFLQQMAAEPEHELRRALDDQLLRMTSQLRTDEDVQARVDDVVQDVITDELLQEWIGRWWRDVRRLVHAAAQEDRRGRAAAGTTGRRGAGHEPPAA